MVRVYNGNNGILLAVSNIDDEIIFVKTYYFVGVVIVDEKH